MRPGFGVHKPCGLGQVAHSLCLNKIRVKIVPLSMVVAGLVNAHIVLGIEPANLVQDTVLFSVCRMPIVVALVCHLPSIYISLLPS